MSLKLSSTRHIAAMAMMFLLFLAQTVHSMHPCLSSHVDHTGNMSSPSVLALFICHDAGESKGLAPVAEALFKENAERDGADAHDDGTNNATISISVCVLALGEPATELFATAAYPVATPQDVGILSPVVDGNPGRHQTLPADDVARFVSFFLAPPNNASSNNTRAYYEHVIVLPGMVYQMQSQLAGALLHSHESSGGYTKVDVLAFDDSFALWNPKSLPAQLFVNPTPAVSRNATKVLVTAKSVAQAINAQVGPGGTPSSVTTGTPTLSVWKGDAANVTERALVNELVWSPRTLPPFVVRGVIVGGYGAGNKEALQMLCDAAKTMAGWVSWVFSPHPGYSPELEAQWFQEWGCGSPHLIRLMGIGSLANVSASTAELIVTSNVSVSQGSTCGGQAIAVGKPHTYLSSYQDVFSHSKIIPNSVTPEAIVTTVNETFRSMKYRVNPADVEAVGIPLNATEHILAQIKDVV